MGKGAWITLAIVAALFGVAMMNRESIAAGVGELVGAARNRAVMIAEMLRAGITDLREQAMLLAQVDHESAGFSRLEESFRYSSADRLMAISATARAKGRPAVEAAIAAGPAAVAELMYGGRLGNTAPGDGYKYRGRGFIQLTGKDNYAAAGKALGVDLVNRPDLAAQPEIAARIALWYWRSRVGTLGASGDVVAVTKRINGGTIGLDDRARLYADYTRKASAGDLA